MKDGEVLKYTSPSFIYSPVESTASDQSSDYQIIAQRFGCVILAPGMSNPIRDLQGGIVGYQDSDGTLRDKNNKRVGHINRDGTVYNNHKEQVGIINARGDVVDRYGREVGSIGADGTVKDWHGIKVYSGSAAPLLIDFEKKAQDPLPSRFEFDQLARQAPEPKAPRGPIALLPEGFVSPSVIGCFGIAAAVVVGFIIMFVLQNPSVLSPSSGTPTLRAVANATRTGGSEENTPEPDVAPTAIPTIEQATGKVNTQILNLREGPATSFEIVDRLQQDTEVVITGRLSDSVWLKVTVPSIGKDGWVAAEYINLSIDVATLPVVQPPSQ
jgi:hypothetical protein